MIEPDQRVSQISGIVSQSPLPRGLNAVLHPSHGRWDQAPTSTVDLSEDMTAGDLIHALRHLRFNEYGAFAALNHQV